MDKQPIFDEAKKELLKMVQGLEIANFAKDIARIQKQVNFLIALEQLENSNERSIKETTEPKEVASKKTSSEKPRYPVQEGYIFERKLKGGYIEAINAYVPEKVVRQLGLDDGDQVAAKPLATDPAHYSPLIKAGYKLRARFSKLKSQPKTHYQFKLIKKGNELSTDRAEIKYCVVEKDGDLWICHKTLSGESIQLNDLPFSILIKETEVKEFNLSEGDIVDIAYAKSNPSISRVVWKHFIDQESHTTPLPSSAYKEKSESQQIIKEHPDLRGKTVTIIGSIDHLSAYREQLTAMGANFQAMDGKEGEARIAALIKRSDFVLIIIPAVSHRGAGLAKKICKASGIPFTTIDTIGKSAVASEAIRMARDSRGSEAKTKCETF
ncbi:DUF2325 domain-containing protein [Camelliibacillus cellulosilyticus]|uniref:DUF2325 domain-containing protein n=1 Tax=Camelliibacillus cellulosilyticus TaxID=2174486 RepID=A0ABV9GRD0_9BACL